jgi:FAD/FMN-containing dehydrogenase
VADPLAEALADVVGHGHVLSAPDSRAEFETDWTGRYGGPARLVVRPADTAQVAGVLAACGAHGTAVVPQGGNTGLVGGGVPRGGEVVLSLRRLNALGEVDPATIQVDAGAGVTLAGLQAHAHSAALDPAVDLAARDSCTLGGLVATDAGGARALRHGTVRARVAGLEVVLADGTIVDRRAGLLKDNAGYDLSALLIGSEGTLGVITAVRWRLVPRLQARVAALVPLGSLAEAVGLFRAVRPELPCLEAADFFLDEGMQLVLDHLRIPAPVAPRAPAYVLLECAEQSDPIERLAAVLDAADAPDAVVADSTSERERLWRVREAHADAIAAEGMPHKVDVGVPLDRLAAFAEDVRAAVKDAAPDARLILFGHLGDGNVHVNVLDAPAGDMVDEAVLHTAAAHGGTISAEHGIGTAKARWLPLVRSDAEIRAMAALKRAFDPDGLLNPGVVLARA